MGYAWSNFAKKNRRLLAVFHIDDHIPKGYFVCLFVCFFFACCANGSHTKHHGVSNSSQCNTTYQNSCKGSGTKVHYQCTPRQTSLITAWCWLFPALKGFVHSELPTNMRKETSRVKNFSYLNWYLSNKNSRFWLVQNPGLFVRNQLPLTKIVKLSVDGRGWGWVLSKFHCNDTTIQASLFQILAAFSAKAILWV